MIIRVLLFAWVATEILLQVRFRGSRRRSSDWTYYLLIASGICAMVTGFRLSSVGWGSFDGGWWAIGAGFALLLSGALFRIWAIVTLGRYFTFRITIQDNHPVIQTGPYRFVRHPGYTGSMIACFGIAVALSSALSIAVLVLVPLASALIRIRVEERDMNAALGDEYLRYAAGKARLLPLVW